MNPLQDAKIAAMVAAVQKLSQVSPCLIFKHQNKETKSRLQPYGLAIVTSKQVVVPAGGSITFT